MTYRVSNFINGQLQESRSERQGAIFNPACGKPQEASGSRAPPSVRRRSPSPSAPLPTGRKPRRWCGPGSFSASRS